MESKISVQFKKLDRFVDDVNVEIGSKITTFVGPNGSGKSTLIEALSLLLEFLKKGSVLAKYDDIKSSLKFSRPTNPSWEEAVLNISFSGNLDEFKVVLLNFMGADKKEKCDKVNVFFNIRMKKYDTISYLQVVKINMSMNGNDKFYETKSDTLKIFTNTEEIKIKSAEIQKIQAEIAQIEIDSQTKRTHMASVSEPKRSRIRSEIESLTKSKTEKEALLKIAIEKQKKFDVENEIILNNDSVIKRTIIEDVMRADLIPGVFVIKTNIDMTNSMDDLREELRQEKCKAMAVSKHNEMLEQLSLFLKAKADTELVNGTKLNITVDGVDVSNLSLGTSIALYFYSLFYKAGKNTILVWDEPENSMHPARRIKLYELMKEQKTKFIIATHATEFAPIYDDGCEIYRNFNITPAHGQPIQCNIKKVSGLFHGFEITKALGLEPSRVLFTANCVIWIEGPSDAVYYRFWINQFATKQKLRLVEGFDYTFVFSGGSLLADICVEDKLLAVDDKKVDEIVNVARVTSSSIFICDSDITEDKKPDNIDDYDIKRKSGQYDKIKEKYKPRVQNIISACEKAGGDCRVIVTYGKEAENYIPKEEFQKISKSTITGDARWAKHELTNKIATALEYVAQNRDNVDVVEMLNDHGEDIKKIVQYIVENKNKYYY